jgi:hypothetical protein
MIRIRQQMQKIILSLIVGASCAGSFSGCSSFHAAPYAYGAVGGAAAGAGTGALVGAVIANGDIAASALLGGAIGIPVGIALAALYDYNSEPSVQERNAVVIEQNQREIFSRQRELDALREDIRNDTPSYNPSEGDRYYHYSGETFGNYYR